MDMPASELPADVTALLAPVILAIRAEAREGVTEAERKRLARVAQEIGQDYTGDYRVGMAAIVAALGGPAPAPVKTGGCRCPECSEPECDGECDRCDDYDCPQCGCSEARSCCGYCGDCDSHHEGGSQEEVIVVRTGRCHHVWCKDCGHSCEDY